MYAPSQPVPIETLQTALSRMIPAGADDGDLYVEHSCSESLALEEGRVKHVSASTHRGLGARVIKGEASGHAYTDRLEAPAIMEAAGSARAIAESGSNPEPVAVHRQTMAAGLYVADNPALSVDFSRRKALLEGLDALARSLDPRVKQVFANISSSFSDIHIIRMDGAYMNDARPLVRLNVSVVVEQNGRRETGSAGGGGRFRCRG